MVTDAAALGLALFADAIARRPPSKRASYGYGRAEVLAAFVNAIAMLAVVAAIASEPGARQVAPPPPSLRSCRLGPPPAPPAPPRPGGGGGPRAPYPPPT